MRISDWSSDVFSSDLFSLLYGLKLPSEIYAAYAFATKLKDAGRPLPQVHLIVKNRITQYMGAASAYAAVLAQIEKDVQGLRSEEHTSELQSLMRISYAVFCLKKKIQLSAINVFYTSIHTTNISITES